MENFKKKTIIWTDHEPPRNYLWVKDNSIYEYTTEWKEADIVIKDFIPVEKVKLNKTQLNLKNGKSIGLAASVFPEDCTDQIITWISSNPEVATVSKSGRVTGKSEGETVIFAAIGGKFDTCEISVY